MRIEVIQLKRGNKTTLEAVLCGERKPADGEPIFEIDTGKLKFGDGQRDYKDLDYFGAHNIEITGSLDGQILIYNELKKSNKLKRSELWKIQVHHFSME